MAWKNLPRAQAVVSLFHLTPFLEDLPAAFCQVISFSHTRTPSEFWHCLANFVLITSFVTASLFIPDIHNKTNLIIGIKWQRRAESSAALKKTAVTRTHKEGQRMPSHVKTKQKTKQIPSAELWTQSLCGWRRRKITGFYIVEESLNCWSSEDIWNLLCLFAYFHREQQKNKKGGGKISSDSFNLSIISMVFIGEMSSDQMW